MDSPTTDGRDSTDGISLRVPGEDRFLELLRAVVGRAARLAGFTYAGIEDFTLAVDEAAVLLMEVKPKHVVLEVGASERDARRLEAVVTVVEARHRWPLAGLDADSRWQVLSALSEVVDVVEGHEPGIRLVQAVR